MQLHRNKIAIINYFYTGTWRITRLRDSVYIIFRLFPCYVILFSFTRMATKQKASRAITKKEFAYLLSRLCAVDATTMRVRIVNGLVVPPFAEGATLPWLGFLLIRLE